MQMMLGWNIFLALQEFVSVTLEINLKQTSFIRYWIILIKLMFKQSCLLEHQSL